MKFTRCPVKVETSNTNPFNSGEGRLPYLQNGSEKLVGYDKIKAYVQKKKYNINVGVKTNGTILRDDSNSDALTNYVFQMLHPYHYYFLFGEPTNYETARALYAKRIPFPFNFYYPSQYHKEAKDIVEVFGGFDINDKIQNHDSDYFVVNAKICIKKLSKTLNENVWFFGDYYSELDTIVYSYLSVLLNINLPNNPIRAFIRGAECVNLVNFINRINKDIFQREGLSVKQDNSMTQSEKDFLSSKRTRQILYGVFVVLAMGGYAVTSGILNVSFDGNHGDDMYIYEDDDDGEV